MTTKQKIVIIISLIGFLIIMGFLFKNTGSNDTGLIDIMMDFNIKVPDKYNEPLLITAMEKTLSIQPVGAKDISKTQEGNNKVKYVEAFQNTDIIQTKTVNKVKEDIVLKEPGHPLEFSYKINIDDFNFKKDSEGNINIYPKAKRKDLYKLFTIPFAFMVDANGVKSSSKDVKMSLEGNVLKLKINKDWLEKHAYPIILDPTVEISVLNIHSHPAKGENWIVEFTTKGKADLKIIPNDQSTIDDDEFVSLSCNGKERKPKILNNDIIFYKAWSCEGVGKVIHYTKKAGKHTLKFVFGPSTAFAYNSSWWNHNWLYRRKITINSTSTATNLTNFPLAIFLNETSSRIDYSKTQDSGQDIRFVDSDDTTELNYEIEEWNESATSTIWVKVPQIDANSTTDYIWMYYGNPSASDNSTTTGVWDSNYQAVLHLNETSGTTVYDSSQNQCTCTISGTVSQNYTNGAVSKAYDFGGGKLECSNCASNLSGAKGTLELWIKADFYRSDTNGYYVSEMFGDSSNYLNLERYCSGGTCDSHPWWGYYRAQGEIDIGKCYDYQITTQGRWVWVMHTWQDNSNGNYVKLYYDDGNQGPDTGWSTSDWSGSVTDWDVGQGHYGTWPFDGKLDEIRISDTVRSTDWMKFSYRSMKDMCLTFGTEEVGNRSPTITSVSDSPDPAPVGAYINFLVDWDDFDSGEKVKAHICKTNSFNTSTLTCTGGSWADTGVFVSDDPLSCYYIAKESDISGSPHSYYVFVCDDNNACSTTTNSGTFSVTSATVPTVKIKGKMKLKGKMKIK